MARRSARRPEPGRMVLPPAVEALVRADLPQTAEQIVTAIVAEVPSYENALNEEMGQIIRNAVRAALSAFLVGVSGDPGRDPQKLLNASLDGAYQLGRGEASSGRTVADLLSAYRIGARVSWRELARHVAAEGSDPAMVAAFAEEVYTYIDRLSAASTQGHTDESATAGRVRQRLLERIATHLVEGAAEAMIVRLAERAEWAVPRTLTAVVVSEHEAAAVYAVLPPNTLSLADVPELDGAAVLLVPDLPVRSRSRVVRSVAAASNDAIIGPARPWTEAKASYERAVRARARNVVGDTEAHLPELVVTADPEALVDLRDQVLAPLAGLRPATRAKLVQTLGAWLLHQGRREEVAAALFVHPQTVRYRVGQLREAFGDALEDPATVQALVIALAVPPEGDETTDPAG